MEVIGHIVLFIAILDISLLIFILFIGRNRYKISSLVKGRLEEKVKTSEEIRDEKINKILKHF